MFLLGINYLIVGVCCLYKTILSDIFIKPAPKVLPLGCTHLGEVSMFLLLYGKSTHLSEYEMLF